MRFSDKTKEFFEQKISHVVVVSLLFFVSIPGVIFGFIYQYKSINNLSSQIKTLSKDLNQIDQKLASTTTILEKNISQTKLSFEETISQERQNVDTKLSTVQSEVGSITGTLSDLEKLSKTDPELLQKYSKVFFLNEHYSPARLIEIPTQYNYFEENPYQIHGKIWPYLQNMIETAKLDGVDLYVYSAYRSFDSQESLKGQYSVVYGSGTANQFSADQGYSEHQLGTTIDLITTGIDGVIEGFEETEAYKWLLKNAHRFGFTLSYPENNSYYVFEPWHWRFVGVALATYLYNNERHFYDLDQRQIDEYLISIFD